MMPNKRGSAANFLRPHRILSAFAPVFTALRRGQQLQRDKRAKLFWFLAVVDGHCAAQQIDDAHIHQFEFAHFGRDGRLRRIVFQRFEDVGVGVRVAAKNPAQQRHRAFQMGKINPAPKGICRFAEILHHQPSARPDHTAHFFQTFFPVRQISQTVTDGDNIERCIGKWNLLRVTLNKNRISGPGFRVRDFVPRFGNFEHLGVEIEAGDFRAAPPQGEGDVAGAAAQIERVITGLNGGELDNAAFPAPVQPETLQVVEQIVAPRNGSEEVVDLCRALFPGGVEGVAHATSLAHWQAQKSKGIK